MVEWVLRLRTVALAGQKLEEKHEDFIYQDEHYPTYRELEVNQMASWSPNGKRIAFMSSRNGYCSVYVTNSDGRDQTDA